MPSGILGYSVTKVSERKLNCNELFKTIIVVLIKQKLPHYFNETWTLFSRYQ